MIEEFLERVEIVYEDEYCVLFVLVILLLFIELFIGDVFFCKKKEVIRVV